MDSILSTNWILVDLYELERKIPGRWAQDVASMDDCHPTDLVYTRRAPTSDGSVESNGTEHESKGINEAIARPVTESRKVIPRVIYIKR